MYPSLFSHSSNESQTQKQQISAETRLSIHDSPFFADIQDTVGTFLAPPDPTADPMLALPSIPTAHGSSHGLTAAAPFNGNPLHNVQYPQYYPSPDIYTYHHSALSSIFTPAGSMGNDSYLFRGSGLSTVTQYEPERDTLPSTQDVPSHDPRTARPVPVPLHSAGAPIPTSHFSSHSLAPFSKHPHRYRVLESPLQAWQP
ncbi:unnamed protein product [Porites evermanni]|uniref:Early growth response 3 n=1 Tax=Porites evermanni TaxID=104178 RepID=A0ABN8LJW9_9CNID|nr:unnamed protein product [Porites evermanni]